MKKKHFDLLFQHYTDAKSPLRFTSPNALFRFFKGKIPRAEIKDFLSSLDVHTLFREHKKSKHFNIIYCYYPRQLCFADLFTFHKLKETTQNEATQILVLIDGFTRKAWCRVLKDKRAGTVLNAIKEIYKNELLRMDFLVVDLGTEFINKSLLAWAESEHCSVITPRTSGHSSHAERFIRTIKRKIMKWIEYNRTENFTQAFQSLVQNYNDSVHSSTQFSPNDLDRSEELQRQVRMENEKKYMLFKKHAPKVKPLKKGQLVRVLIDKGKLGRGFSKTFSDEIFVVESRDFRKPITLYQLCTLDGKESIIGKWYRGELNPIYLRKDEHISKIIKKDDQKVLVTFKGIHPAKKVWIYKHNLLDLT